MKHPLSLVALIAWVTIPALCVGCGDFGEPSANRCETDADCADESLCDRSLQICVAAPNDPLRIAIEVVPMSAGMESVLPITFDEFRLDGPQDQDLTIPLLATVEGMVVLAGEPVVADLTFSLVGGFESGPSRVVSTEAFAEPIARGDREVNYSAQLIPGRTYEVAVHPTGAGRSELPPLRFRLESPPSGTVVLQDLEYPDFILDEPSLNIRGLVVDVDGRPQNDFIVRAVDSTSGQTVSSIYLTGSGDDEAELGEFRIRLAPNVESFILVVSPASSREGIAASFEVNPSVLIEDEEGVVTILTPSSDAVITYSGLVEGVLDDEMRPIEAALSFVSRDVLDSVTGVVGSVQLSTTSNDEGEFEVELLPGTYDIVVSSQDSEFGVLVESDVQIVAEDGRDLINGQLFAVPARGVISGWVETPTGNRMVNASIVAEPRGGSEEVGPQARFARASVVLTDGAGAFELQLDAGVYDVIVEPASGSNFPWHIATDRVVRAGETALAQAHILGDPVPVSGVVRIDDRGGPDGMGTIAVAEVRAYVLSTDATGALRPVQVARTTSDENGRYTLLVPPSL